MNTSKNQMVLLRCAAPWVSCLNHYYNYYAATQLFKVQRTENICSKANE
jgi:hypothetical protein